MRRLFIYVLAIAAVGGGTAFAQTPATRSQLESQNNAAIVPNTVGAVTPQKLNTLLGNAFASMGTLLDAQTWALQQTFTLSPIISALSGAGNRCAALSSTGALNAVGGCLSATTFGADPTGNTDSAVAFLAGCTAAQASYNALSVNGTFKFASNVTLPCDLAFSPGSMLVPVPGVIVTISGRVAAPMTQQIFGTPVAPVATTGNTTAASATLALSSTTGIHVGDLVDGPYVPPSTVVLSIGTGNVTLSNNAIGTLPNVIPLTYTFQPVGVILATSAMGPQQEASVAWWGALAAANAGNDAAPSIRAAVGSYRHLYFPQATYPIKSATASPYPPATGTGANVGIDFYGAVNFSVSGQDAVLAPNAASSNTSMTVWRYNSNFDVSGLHFKAYSASFTGSISTTTLTAPVSADIANGVAITGPGVTAGTYVTSNGTCGVSTCTYSVNNSQTVGSETLTAGLPCCEPNGLQILNISKFSFHDLWWEGNWGGTTKVPAAFAIAWAKEGTFHDLHMPQACIGADAGWVQNTHWYSIRAQGADDSGASTNGNCNFISVENNPQLQNYWPGITSDANYVNSIDNTFGPGIDATGFGASLAFRAGSRYRIIGNDLSNNPLGFNGSGHGIGAGVYMWYETLPGVETGTDPVSDVTINGNTINANGQAGTTTGALCNTTVGTGAGVVVDGTCASQATSWDYTTNQASASGTVLHFAPLTLVGDLLSSGITWTVTDTTNAGAIPAATHLSSADLFQGTMTLSAGVTSVGNGDTIHVTTNDFKAVAGLAVSKVNISGNVFDNNNSTGIQSLGAPGLSAIGIGINQFSGANQTTRINTVTMAALGDASSGPLGGACSPVFDPGVFTTGYCVQGMSATENVVSFPATRDSQVRGLFVSLNTAPGAGKSYTFTVRANAGDTPITCAITNPATACEDVNPSHLAAVAAGQPVDLKITALDAATAAAIVTWSTQLASP